MKVLLRNPRRELDVKGPITVHALLARLDAMNDTYATLPRELVTGDSRLDDAASVEIRPVTGVLDDWFPMTGVR